MLCVVAFRNLIELSGSEFDFTEGFTLPKSFGWFRGNNVLWTISYVRFLISFNLLGPSSGFVFERDLACRNGDGFGDAGGLAQTCLHY